MNAQVLPQDGVSSVFCGISPEEAMSIHKRFLEMRQKKDLKPLPFLRQEKEGLDPIMGLFESLYQLEYCLDCIRKTLEVSQRLLRRISQLIELALHFNCQMEESHEGLPFYLGKLWSQAGALNSVAHVIY